MNKVRMRASWRKYAFPISLRTEDDIVVCPIRAVIFSDYDEVILSTFT